MTKTLYDYTLVEGKLVNAYKQYIKVDICPSCDQEHLFEFYTDDYNSRVINTMVNCPLNEQDLFVIETFIKEGTTFLSYIDSQPKEIEDGK